MYLYLNKYDFDLKYYTYEIKRKQSIVGIGNIFNWLEN